MRAAEVAFVGALVHRFPVLLPILQGHLDDYDGLLPHVLMGDITRWVLNEFRSHGPSRTFTEILDFFEESLRKAHEHERELIAVSFLENLPRPDEPGAEVRELLGSALRHQLELIG